MSYILSLPIKRVSKLYKKAMEENEREKAYRQWLAHYPRFTADTFETFEEFYELLHPPKIQMDLRSKDEIMNELLGKEE